MGDITVLGFEFDEANRAHLALKGIDEGLILEVFMGRPRYFREMRPGRSGSHRMIGPDVHGRSWTIVLTEADPDAGTWRPITGWPSTSKEVRAWRDEA